MPIFFAGKTKCRICNEEILLQAEAVVLPYVDIKTFPSYIPFSGGFVHRKCYDNWAEKEKYARASFELIERAVQDKTYPGVIYSGELLHVRYDESNKLFIIHDYAQIFDFEIEAADRRKLSDELVYFLRSGQDEHFLYHNWNLAHAGNNVLFEKRSTGTLEDSVYLPFKRFEAWIAALEYIAGAEM